MASSLVPSSRGSEILGKKGLEVREVVEPLTLAHTVFNGEGAVSGGFWDAAARYGGTKTK